MSDTRKDIIFTTGSLLVALVFAASYLSSFLGLRWPIVDSFFVSLLASGAFYVGIFFHEIGHALTGWLFGYVMVPTFDFAHGGGMAYSFGRYQILVFALYFVWAALIYTCRYDRQQVMFLLASFALHALINFTFLHHVLIDYMGHGIEMLIASYMLWRCWNNRAASGGLERGLNGVFGFSIIFNNMILSWTLMTSDIARIQYLNQKGQHGFGDYSKIQRAFGFESLTPICLFSLFLALACLALPFFIMRRQDDFDDN